MIEIIAACVGLVIIGILIYMVVKNRLNRSNDHVYRRSQRYTGSCGGSCDDSINYATTYFNVVNTNCDSSSDCSSGGDCGCGD